MIYFIIGIVIGWILNEFCDATINILLRKK